MLTNMLLPLLYHTCPTGWPAGHPVCLPHTETSVLCSTRPAMYAMLIQVTLGQLAEEVKQEAEQQTGGAVDYTARRKSNLDKVPGWELRPGAPKMQLRPKEEALLPLVRTAATFGCSTTCNCQHLQSVTHPVGYLTPQPTSFVAAHPEKCCTSVTTRSHTDWIVTCAQTYMVS